MRKELEDALNVVEMTYGEIVEIANKLIAQYTGDINPIIQYIEANIEKLSNDEIRSLMLRLSVKAYSFCEIKERSITKADCAEIIKKEAYARIFNQTEGSVATKDNTSLVNISNEIVTQAVYNLVAGLFKVKFEEIRRLVDTLKTILMSRLSEMKLSSNVTREVEENQ